MQYNGRTFVRYSASEMPATKQRSTREAILDRAVDLASEEGLEGLTIGRLASELEMSKSGLFGHFGSKEELQLAAVDAAAKRFAEEVVRPAVEVPVGIERLRALCDNYIGYMEREVFPGGCFWAAVTTEFDDRPGPVRDRIRDAMAAWLGGLEGEAEAAGVDDPAQLAFELFAVGQAANTRSRLFGDREGFGRARAAIDRLLERG
jgi:AcrR family transcriptional regulator